MKKSLWIIALLFVVAGAPNAHAGSIPASPVKRYHYLFEIIDQTTVKLAGSFTTNQTIVPTAVTTDFGIVSFASSTPMFTCLGVCAGGTPTASPVTFPSPNITETWDGFTTSFTLQASDAPSDSYTWANSAGPDFVGATPEPPTWIYFITVVGFLGLLLTKLKAL